MIKQPTNSRAFTFFRQSLRKQQFRKYVEEILSRDEVSFTIHDLSISFFDIKKSHHEAIKKGFVSRQGFRTISYTDRVRGRVQVWKLNPALRRIAEEEFDKEMLIEQTMTPNALTDVEVSNEG